MSYGTDINTLMNADSTINGLIDGAYYLNPPDNTAMTGNYIVFAYDLIDDISVLEQNNIIDIYKHNIAIYAADTVTVDNITTAVRSYLDNYSDATFREVKLVMDERGIDGEKEQYANVLEYRIFYQN